MIRTENIGEKRVQINFQEYLSSELRKASKGSYSVSVIMFTLDKEVDNKTGIDGQEFLRAFDHIYRSLNELFWETDLFVKYGQQSYIGIFPFSDGNNTQVILAKIYKCFDDLQSQEKYLKPYKLINTFVTYPTDGTGKDEIIETLITKHNEINNPAVLQDATEADVKNVDNEVQ